MKTTFIIILTFFIASSMDAQYDDTQIDFKRNTLRFGFGNRYINENNVSKRNFEAELERTLTKYISGSVSYNYLGNHNAVSHFSNNQFQLNLKYFPFTNLKIGKLSLGAGLFHNTINHSRIRVSDNNSITIERYGTFELGYQFLAGYSFNFTKQFSLGFKAYLQKTSVKLNTIGGAYTLGYSF